MSSAGAPGLFLAGVAIGLAIAAPVGPMAVLCIRRSLASRSRGLASGLGIATADVTYALTGAFAVGVAGSLLAHSRLIQAAGGAALVVIGARTLLMRPADLGAAAAERSAAGLARDYAGTFLLTLANPPTIAFFAAVMASVGIGRAGDIPGTVAAVAGVGVGSAAWWITLTYGVSRYGRRLPAGLVGWIDRVAGGVLLLAGAVAVGAAAGWLSGR